MAEQQEQHSKAPHYCFCCFLFVVIPAIIVCFVVLFATSKDATFSVTVTSVAGLDPAADLSSARPALSPVFNLTVRVDNARDRFNSACVTSFAAAAVSYEDAFLGRGSVPEFCAGARKVRERGARAWGDGVALPRFLRDQMAGEMAVGEVAVDVQVTMPGNGSDMVLVCTKVKIGGGPAPCRMEFVYHHFHHHHEDEDIKQRT